MRVLSVAFPTVLSSIKIHHALCKLYVNAQNFISFSIH